MHSFEFFLASFILKGKKELAIDLRAFSSRILADEAADFRGRFFEVDLSVLVQVHLVDDLFPAGYHHFLLLF